MMMNISSPLSRKRMPPRELPTSVEAEVQKALDLMDRIETVCGNPAAREELNRLVQDLGIRIGLTFREGHRNNRSARILQGGIVAFGNQPLPCTLRNSSGRPLVGGLPEQADDGHQGDRSDGQHHRQKEHPDEATGSATGSKKAPFQSEGRIDRIETHVAGRRATLTGRSSNTSPTIRDRRVIQGKSGQQDLNL